MKEIEVTKETVVEKPEFKNEIKVEITETSKIEDNIQEVKEYAINLANYYENIIFTEETLKEATNEKAEINKFKKKVEDCRKAVSKKWNEPLEKFIEDAKETEKILENTYNSINSQVIHYQNAQKQEKEKEVKEYFEELVMREQIDFVDYSKANINVTLSASMKSLKEQVKSFVEKIVDDINLIDTQENTDEIMIEYKKDLNVSRAITEVKNRHAELEKIKEDKENKQEQELTDEEMLNKIESLSAPKVVDNNDGQQEEILELTFKVRGTREKLRLVKEFLDNGGYDYE